LAAQPTISLRFPPLFAVGPTVCGDWVGNSMRAIIHFSYFHQTGDEDYIVKEVAIVNPDANTMEN